VDLEYWDREWADEQEPGSNEPSEWAQFEATVDQLARTPGASQAGHTAAAILREYAAWVQDMQLSNVGDVPAVSADSLAAARDMPSWQWWLSFGKRWPHLRWFVMRLTVQGCSACACERNWSTCEWVHSKKRNQLRVSRAEKLVRSFSNINLVYKFEAVRNCFILWDLEMIIDKPDDAWVPAREPPRSSPRLAAARSRGGRGAGRAAGNARGRGRGLFG
jgi:hypothetical protein